MTKKTEITFREIENALRHVRQYADKGSEEPFNVSAEYLRAMVDRFVSQENARLARNSR